MQRPGSRYLQAPSLILLFCGVAGFVLIKEMSAEGKKRAHEDVKGEECDLAESGTKKGKVSTQAFPLSVKFW